MRAIWQRAHCQVLHQWVEEGRGRRNSDWLSDYSSIKNTTVALLNWWRRKVSYNINVRSCYDDTYTNFVFTSQWCCNGSTFAYRFEGLGFEYRLGCCSLRWSRTCRWQPTGPSLDNFISSSWRQVVIEPDVFKSANGQPQISHTQGWKPSKLVVLIDTIRQHFTIN